MSNGNSEALSRIAAAAEALDQQFTEIEELVEALRDKAFEALKAKNPTSGALRVVHLYKEVLATAVTLRGKYAEKVDDLRFFEAVMDAIEDADDELYERLIEEFQKIEMINERLRGAV